MRAGRKYVSPVDSLSCVQIPQRFLMGPGPANAHPRILAAQTLPLLGHMYADTALIAAFILQGLSLPILLHCIDPSKLTQPAVSLSCACAASLGSKTCF